MTLEEAIKYEEEVAEEQDKLCKQYDNASRYFGSHNEDIVSANAKKCLECFECAKEHRQLAEWLKELKRLRKQTRREQMSQEVTPQFAIDYLLDDCEDCPENKDGECVTESHCFEVKQMCIKALRGQTERRK